MTAAPLAHLLPLLPLDYSTIQLCNPAAPSRQAGSALRSDQTQKSLNSPSPMEITSSGLTSPPRRISDFFSGTVTSFSLALFTGSAMALWTSAPTLVPPAIYFLLTAYCLLIPAAATIIVSFVRTVLEDNTLKRELAGYSQYAEKVRYRLIPGIW